VLRSGRTCGDHVRLQRLLRGQLLLQPYQEGSASRHVHRVPRGLAATVQGGRLGGAAVRGAPVTRERVCSLIHLYAAN
jgi:hypothetical protein